jgi:hypothetical protein
MVKNIYFEYPNYVTFWSFLLLLPLAFRYSLKQNFMPQLENNSDTEMLHIRFVRSLYLYQNLQPSAYYHSLLVLFIMSVHETHINNKILILHVSQGRKYNGAQSKHTPVHTNNESIPVLIAFQLVGLCCYSWREMEQ